jgi:hypothetical protein
MPSQFRQKNAKHRITTGWRCLATSSSSNPWDVRQSGMAEAGSRALSKADSENVLASVNQENQHHPRPLREGFAPHRSAVKGAARRNCDAPRGTFDSCSSGGTLPARERER